jgi:2-dehydro-3-deoxygluconokinase
VPDLVSLGEALVELAADGSLEEAQVYRRGFGGDTSNFAVAAARLGARVAYVTRVGDDGFGRALLSMWKREGVDTRYVQVAADEPTGIYFLARAADGQGRFTYYRTNSAASRLSPQEVPAEAVDGARLLHTSGITQAISPSAREAVRWAMERARRAGVRVSYDLNVRPKLLPLDRFREAVLEALPMADLAFLSTEDAGYVFAGLEDEEVLRAVLDAGARVAVLKRGERGCAVATADGDRVTLPGWPVDAVDPTGAGDAFDAAFAIQWLAGRPLDEVGRFANAVGALATTGVGATAALPTRAKVEAFLARHRAV